LLVGGTGLYVRAVLQGYTFSPIETDWELRRRLANLARAEGPEALHRRLRAVDPAVAGRVHPHNVRRVVRALEVFEQTGRRLSEIEGQRAGPDRYDALRIGLTRDRDELYGRIETRALTQLEGGLLDEVRRLLDAGYAPDLP